MKIPAQITNGDSISWIDDPSFDNLKNPVSPPSWTLKYTIVGAQKLELTAAQQGGGWKTTMSAAQSLLLSAGEYYWTAFATNGSDQVTLGRGKLVILPNLHLQSAGTDNRSQTKKDLEAVQGAMRAMISGGAVSKYMIGHRQVEKMSMTDLITLESKLKFQLAREERADRVKNGQGNPNNSLVRF